jgi:glycosyltransferase involved in cell wall biosynthesis
LTEGHASPSSASSAVHPPAEIGFSVVVPVYDSTRSLGELVERLSQVFDGPLRATYEIILVDDASPDPGTWAVIERLVAGHPEVRALQLTRNSGRAAAVLAGLAEARGTHVVVMDDDLQHSPEDLPKLVARSSHDVVIARFTVRHHPWSSRWSSRVKGFFDRAAGMPKGLTMSSYLLLRRDVAKHMCAVRAPDPSIPGLLFYVTRDAVNVDVLHSPRPYGRSAFGFRARVRLFVGLALNNTWLPLQVSAVLGTIAAGSSLVYAAYLAIRYFSRDTVIPGGTSAMVVSLFLGGCILATLGVLGRAVLHLLRAAEGRPAAYVRRRVHNEAQRCGDRTTPHP